jgi:hypothetical protein
LAKAQEDFTDSVSEPDTENEIKAQESVSDANSYARRKRGPKSN